MERIGQFGWRAKKIVRRLNEEHGEHGWELRWKWGDEFIPFAMAIQLYEDAYVSHFTKNKEVLENLLASAVDVYDISPRDRESGLDYSIQQHKAAHYQDIAVRRSVLRLGRKFHGNELLQIRGVESPLYHLNPGVVQFHLPEMIERPALSGWWGPDSIEDFYQSNKYVISLRDQKSPHTTVSVPQTCSSATVDAEE